jgi:hypothetical protein
MAPEWRHGSNLELRMGVSLSIKGVPEALAERLRRRAARNHRSLQRELMALLEAAAEGGVGAASGEGGRAQTSGARARVAEPEAVYAAAVPAEEGGTAGGCDDLLAELDAIVAGSRWAEGPLLTREQLHDRALARELDFDARTEELAHARRQQIGRPAA